MVINGSNNTVLNSSIQFMCVGVYTMSSGVSDVYNNYKIDQVK